MPDTVPMPPESDVPPMTTPAIARSSMPLPVLGMMDVYAEAYTIAPRPAKKPLMT